MRRALALSFLGLILLAGSGAAAAQEVQILSPGITFTAQEVFFRQPVTYLGPDGKPRSARVALKLLLAGEGFYEGATGPRYYLGERRADAHYTSPDGRQVAVYFYDPERIAPRAPLRIETRPGRFLTLEQRFDAGRVRWLSPEVRRRHDLPDLRRRVAAEPVG